MWYSLFSYEQIIKLLNINAKMKKIIFERKIIFFFKFTTLTFIGVAIIFSSIMFLGCASQLPSNQVSKESIATDLSISQFTETTKEQIPEDIKELLTEADNYYSSGYYSEALSAYRTLKNLINNSTTISQELKDELLLKINTNYEKSKSITGTARVHFGNAMQLEYEKRLEEAIEELEKAIEIYPKYKDAVNTLESLKTIYNLKS